MAESIRSAVQAAAATHDPPLHGLTLSMGVACSGGEHEGSADALFARADAALYEAKRMGRNRVEVDDEGLRGEPSVSAHGRHL
jgi:diguanylate cyclase (GGDEF)-like protein